MPQFTGKSFWQGEVEESSTFQLLHEAEFAPGDYEMIRNLLKSKAREYRQEAIALIPAVRADLVPPATEGPIVIPA